MSSPTVKVARQKLVAAAEKLDEGNGYTYAQLKALPEWDEYERAWDNQVGGE